MVKDNDADANRVGSMAAQQMNLIQVNHENLQPSSSKVVFLMVRPPSEIGLSEEEIRTKYADVF